MSHWNLYKNLLSSLVHSFIRVVHTVLFCNNKIKRHRISIKRLKIKVILKPGEFKLYLK